jgi:glyoxylase-like metal-dependent hydrolase (beta-lactamase superfamily II)
LKYELNEVGDGVWAAIVDDDRPAIGNAAIVDAGDETLVFDTTLSFRLASQLREDARRLTGRDPAILVNSHWHGDHTLGNQSFADLRIVSTTRTKELVETVGAERLAENKKLYADEFPELHEVELTPPTEVFDDLLELGRAEVVTYGGGHTESDAVIWLADAAVLLAADLVVIDRHAWVGHGDVRSWREILARLGELDPEIVVPGHGPVGIGGDIDLMDAYLETLLGLEQGAPMPPELEDLADPEMFDRNMTALHGPI